MSTDTHLNLAPVDEKVMESIVIAEFQRALDTCVTKWGRGEDMVALDNDLHGLFGDLLFRYFERSLIEQVGEPVNFTKIDAGIMIHTLVMMPKNNVGQGISSPETNIETPEIPTATVVTKRAPRPMNCWIIFRDAMHKKLKIEYPHLTVQEISTRCSQIWHALSPSEKKIWQAAAKSAKEEHLRQHPDYKYSPRKPGEKKKRQSQKAKRAAAASVGTEGFNSGMIPKTSPIPRMVLSYAIPASTTVDGIENTFVGEAALFNDPAGFMPQDHLVTGFVSDTESLRHSRLEAEFGTDVEHNVEHDVEHDVEQDSQVDLDDEDSIAFRAGADGNATLPEFFSEAL